jgi:hypothetical protein
MFTEMKFGNFDKAIPTGVNVSSAVNIPSLTIKNSYNVKSKKEKKSCAR